MKKYNKTTFSKLMLVIYVVVLISVVLYLTIFFASFFKQNPHMQNFKNYKKDYMAICEKIIDLSKTNEWTFDKEKYYFIDDIVNYDNQQISFISYEYKSPYTKYPQDKLSYELSQNYKRISESFPSEHGYELEFICYRENRISFHSENGRYAIVYSFDDTKPKFWVAPSEEDKMKVKKIEKNWYHMWR